MASLDQNINGQYSVMLNTRAYPQMIVTQLSQNSTNNTSTLRVTYRVQRPNTAWYVTGYYDHTPYAGASLGWRSQWVNFAQYGNSVETVLTHDFTVNHNADGTGSVNVRWIGDLGTGWGTHDFNADVTLNTITRATTSSTQSASSVTSSSATANGTVTDVGIPSATDKGIYWGTSSGNLPNKISVGSGGAGAFTVAMTSLSPNTTYYYKAFSQNSGGYGYGSEVNFTTSAVAPTVTTQDCSSVYSVKATANGNITNVYGANATRRGFCYMTGTTGDPTTSNSVVYDDGDFGTGTFNKVITGLSPSTNYRVRPYATNSAGTGYGTTVQLTTLTDEHTLEVSDTMAVGDSYSLRKALKMAGVLQIGTYGGWYVGANYWAGGFARNFIEEFVDSLKVRDNMSKIAGYVRDLVESISLTESFNASMLYVKGLVDSIVASDLYANSVGKVLQSVVAVTDAFASTMALVREFVESVVLQEVFITAKLFIKILQDSITLADTILQVLGKYFVDAINVVDNWWKAFVISLVDTISLEDVLSGFTKTYKRVMQEIISISDLVSKNATIVLASIVKVLDGEFVRKLNGQLIAWGKGIRKVLEWAKVVKKEDEYLTIERKLNDWEVEEKDLGLYESKVKPLDEWTKLRKEK